MIEDPTNNLKSVEAFFRALETNQTNLFDTLLDEEAVVTAATSFDGSQEPAAEFKGKAAAAAYLRSIPANFSQVAFNNRQNFVTADGSVIFVESRGDLVVRSTGTPYRNVYIFKFGFRDGKLLSFVENGNPVTFAKAFGLPLGVNPPIPTQ